MKNKTLILIGILLSIGGLLVYCGAATLPPKPVPAAIDFISNLFGKNIVLVTGVDFQTGKSVVLNPITGEAVTACDSQSTKAGCTTQLISSDPQISNPNPELTSAINSSQKIIFGVINKNGKNIPARFVVTVTALYEGSNCATYISAGSQWESCTTLEIDCNSLLPLVRYGNKTESIRKNVRNVCGGIPKTGIVATLPAPSWRKQWREKDCKTLRSVYRKAPPPTIAETPSTGAVTYTLAYKQYIWDSCKDIALPTPQTWGARP
ncbi:hypothetical protein [Crenothrix polyspora]|uniref:Uncharacterized protein n=1 Tax=Crenothrix polyspora TaxID=360316 RepID=A0A1R4HH74_9GAMM|nr:hypothetical protein [Crenothrix polyspora]SJM95573.1 hypothetical protein CRENPOLYSF1_730007 [Crenothrix polyspora]